MKLKNHLTTKKPLLHFVKKGSKFVTSYTYKYAKKIEM